MTRRPAQRSHHYAARFPQLPHEAVRGNSHVSVRTQPISVPARRLGIAHRTPRTVTEPLAIFFFSGPPTGTRPEPARHPPAPANSRRDHKRAPWPPSLPSKPPAKGNSQAVPVHTLLQLLPRPSLPRIRTLVSIPPSPSTRTHSSEGRGAPRNKHWRNRHAHRADANLILAHARRHALQQAQLAHQRGMVGNAHRTPRPQRQPFEIRLAAVSVAAV